MADKVKCPECGSTDIRETGSLLAECYVNDEDIATQIFYDTWNVEYWECQDCDHEWEPGS